MLSARLHPPTLTTQPLTSWSRPPFLTRVAPHQPLTSPTRPLLDKGCSPPTLHELGLAPFLTRVASANLHELESLAAVADSHEIQSALPSRLGAGPLLHKGWTPPPPNASASRVEKARPVDKELPPPPPSPSLGVAASFLTRVGPLQPFTRSALSRRSWPMSDPPISTIPAGAASQKAHCSCYPYYRKPT